MKIYGIKCREVMACAGSWAVIAEAAVEEDDGSETYVMIQEYDGTEYTVSKESLYGYLAENGPEPVIEFLEEYTKLKDAKTSRYADVFAKLMKVVKMLGRTE